MRRLLGLLAVAALLVSASSEGASPPTEHECRPYIEKALAQGTHAAVTEEEETSVEVMEPDTEGAGDQPKQDYTETTQEGAESTETTQEGAESTETTEEGAESTETTQEAELESTETTEEGAESTETTQETELESTETAQEGAESTETTRGVESTESNEEGSESTETTQEAKLESTETTQGAESTETTQEGAESTESNEEGAESAETAEGGEVESAETTDQTGESAETPEAVEFTEILEEVAAEATESAESTEGSTESAETAEGGEIESAENQEEGYVADEAKQDSTETAEEAAESSELPEEIIELTETPEGEVESAESTETAEEVAVEATESTETPEEITESTETAEVAVEATESVETAEVAVEATESAETAEETTESTETPEEITESTETQEEITESAETAEEPLESAEPADEVTEEVVEEIEAVVVEDAPPTPEEDLTLEFEIPDNLRPRDHIAQILRLDDASTATEGALSQTAAATLKELKRYYDSAIKPLETLYKYRDLSNRHFGDPEIFSKPLVLFMGPWSGGKSSIINYLLDNEYKHTSLRTGAEPSPAYFNILMHGEREEVLDGTQLAADWTFSGLQKFGQGLLDRLRGLRLNSRLLEKVNIVEIPGILEIRKQVERVFPFNDACQWFIDRADIIFLVYDPSKLDVGPETEAILDQLKGREMQTRIVLNKADQVRPEELMRVQGTLIWNISPLMSSTQPPVMYSTSLWSRPYEEGAPLRLLKAQERAFLQDMRGAIEQRVESKIASARRFAVRVRNHAKMVDCYLTTYYNHKSLFGNRKAVSEDIISKPQDYHIYEGLSTLTNISRYDLPDPESYRDFFRVNPLYDFQQLSATCTYFKGCPINRLDVAIAYDLPELVGKYKKARSEANS